MRLEQLRYFVMVAKLGSIHKAAETLYVSQPNISRAINSLEEEVGTQILLRDNKGTKLTKAGESLFFYAQTIVGHMEAIERLKYARDMDVISYLKVAVARLFIPDNMMREVSNQLQSNKKVIHLDETNIEGVMDKIQKLEAEIGIVVVNHLQLQAFHKIAELQGIEVHEIGVSDTCIHVGKQSVLASYDTISMPELLAYTNIRMPQDFYSNFFDTVSIDTVSMMDFKNLLYMNNYHSIINMLKHKDAFIFGHRWQIDELDRCGIKTINLKNCDLKNNMFWVKRKKEILSEEAECFMALLTKLYSV